MKQENHRFESDEEIERQVDQAFEESLENINNMYDEVEHLIRTKRDENLHVPDYVGLDSRAREIRVGDIVSYDDTKEGKQRFAVVKYETLEYGYSPMCYGNFRNLVVVSSVYEDPDDVDLEEVIY